MHNGTLGKMDREEFLKGVIQALEDLEKRPLQEPNCSSLAHEKLLYDFAVSWIIRYLEPRRITFPLGVQFYKLDLSTRD